MAFPSPRSQPQEGDGLLGPRMSLANRSSHPANALLMKRVAAYVHDLLRTTLFHIPVFIFIVALLILFQEEGRIVAALSAFFGVSSFLIPWLYFASAESSFRQATKGKRAEGFIVVDKAGRRISFCRATLRHLLFLLCSLTFGLAFIPGLFSKKGLFLHDYLSRTRVVPSTPATPGFSTR
ncbi:RDD family protein [Desulfocurvibacter africanus]|uniref:RDD family protein n=1 Tax=Desulfocurvibacter africanus TaxID=873 RepID=UPI003A4E1549